MTRDESQQFLTNHGVTHLKVVKDPVGYPDAVTVRLVEALQTSQVTETQFQRAVVESALGLKEGAVLDLPHHQFQQLLSELVQSSIKVDVPANMSLIAH